MPKGTRLKQNAAIYQKRESLTEKQKLSQMTPKERIRYFNDYYRNKVIAGIIVLAFVIYFISSIFSPSIETHLYIAVVNDYLNPDSEETFIQKISEYLNLDPKKEEVIIDSNYYLKDNSTDAYYLVRKLSSYIYAGDIDIIIADKEQFNTYLKNDYFTNLEDILPTDLYSSLSDKFYIGTTDKENTKEAAYGLFLDSSSLYQSLGGYLDKPILGVIVNSKRTNTAVNAIRYFFQK